MQHFCEVPKKCCIKCIDTYMYTYILTILHLKYFPEKVKWCNTEDNGVQVLKVNGNELQEVTGFSCVTSYTSLTASQLCDDSIFLLCSIVTIFIALVYQINTIVLVTYPWLTTYICKCFEAFETRGSKKWSSTVVSTSTAFLSVCSIERFSLLKKTVSMTYFSQIPTTSADTDAFNRLILLWS